VYATPEGLATCFRSENSEEPRVETWPPDDAELDIEGDPAGWPSWTDDYCFETSDAKGGGR
jgi:hypothetical protein